MEERSVTRNAAVVGAFTGLSRILGLVREILTARMFGTSLVQSAFVVAFTVPNLFRRLFGEGALSAAFIPAFERSCARESRQDALRMARRVLTSAGVLLFSIVLLGIATAWAAERFVTPGGRLAMALPLLRIMLPYAWFICLAALTMGMLNVLGDFRTPAIAPAILNIVWILVLVGIVPLLPGSLWTRVLGVSFGIVAAGLLQFAYQWAALRRKGWTILPETGGWNDPRVRRVWQQALPAAIGAGVIQINVCLDFLLAYWAADWAPSALTYADRILYLPMGVVATAFGTVLLPTFSKHYTQGDLPKLRETLRSSLEDLSLLMVPAAAGLLFLAGPIVATLYERGNFDAQGTVRTARALACYAPGLFVFSIHKVLNPLFYGMHDTRTPMRISAFGVLLNLTLNLIFVLTWPVEWKHAGIAVSTVISSAVACLLLARLARRRIGPIGWGRVLTTAARAAIASIAMGLAARWAWSRTSGLATRHDVLPGELSRMIGLAAAIGLAAGVYGACLFLIRPDETKRLLATVRRLRKRTRS